MNFKMEAFQNRYLAPDTNRVDAILSIAAEGGVASAPSDLMIGFIVDSSGSMDGSRINAVKQAVLSALRLLSESTYFFVVAFQNSGQVICRPALATAANKAAATERIGYLVANGGTAMSRGLAAARECFATMPNAIHQAIFLTDGKNESERPTAVAEELQRCVGLFECDCWGVGTDWRVGEVQEIARALLGKASLIPDAAGIEAAFSAAVSKAQQKAIKDVRLRFWAPVGAQVVFVKQVNPTIEELTNKVVDLSPQVREYYTGTWGAGEERDYHIAIQVKPGTVGDEMLAARPSLVYQVAGPGGWTEQEDKFPEARLFAVWTADDSLSSRLDQQVAHYTGQSELADAIQEGLAARAQGNEALATSKLGRAVQLAHQSGNVEMTSRLTKVVEVVNPATGTVRLKRDVAKAAEMDLQLESTTTRRARKPAPDPAAGGNPSGAAS